MALTAQRFVIKNDQFFTLILKPMFADLMPDGQFDGTLHEFTLIDPVPGSGLKMRNITGVQNILQRRDASCKLNYAQVASVTGHKILVEELYGAAEHCQNEFYQGCLKDYRNNKALFGQLILSYFKKAIKADITSNAYFGDVASAPNSVWSINKFDGIFTWIKRFITDGTIPSAQSFTIDTTYTDTDKNLTPSGAFNLLKAMYDAQSTLLYSMADTAKAFYVTKQFASAYWDYLIGTGAAYTTTASQFMNGMPPLSYKGIPLIYEPLWDPILRSLNSNQPTHAAILTLRGNFTYGTDSTYGEGPDLNESLRVRYDEDELLWRYSMFMKGGTQIALPEHVIVAMTSY